MDEESDDEESGGTLEQAGTQPSKVLYVAGLPQEITSDMLSALFQQ